MKKLWRRLLCRHKVVVCFHCADPICLVTSDFRCLLCGKVEQHPFHYYGQY